MSPAGITDVGKYGGSIFENMNLAMSIGMRGMSPLWKTKLTIQDISQTFLVKNVIDYRLKKRFDISVEENDIFRERAEIIFKYPKDLDTALYFIFKHPFPTAVVPLEDLIKEKIPDINIIFCYGELDWMDNSGAKRLNQYDKNKYKYFTIYNAGHNFPLDNPGEPAKILLHEI
jgi:pimeloyl-ACP methyl ester carboxylesterase